MPATAKAGSIAGASRHQADVHGTHSRDGPGQARPARNKVPPAAHHAHASWSVQTIGGAQRKLVSKNIA